LSDSRLRAQPLGDSAVTILFGTERSTDLLKRVHSAAATVSKAAFPEVEDVVTAYLSLAVFYDSQKASFREIADKILALCEGDTAASVGRAPFRTHDIPVVYDGPDLATVAAALGLSVNETIARHLSRTYNVELIGFVPGFAYLGELDTGLRLPRRPQPRPRVKAGSVGIAGAQTGIYPLDTPGGWHILGRTDTVMFDPARNPPAILSPGDTVRFVRAG
jgi:KipI family sensor histidine kinase inhibitor